MDRTSVQLDGWLGDRAKTRICGALPPRAGERRRRCVCQAGATQGDATGVLPCTLRDRQSKRTSILAVRRWMTCQRPYARTSAEDNTHTLSDTVLYSVHYFINRNSALDNQRQHAKESSESAPACAARRPCKRRSLAVPLHRLRSAKSPAARGGVRCASP